MTYSNATAHHRHQSASAASSHAPATRLFLALSGAMLALVGASILFVPHAFYASNQIELGVQPNLMSEIRAPGGLFLASGLVIVAGAFRSRLQQFALAICAISFGMTGLSRLVSLFFDGLPTASILIALGIELVVAAIALARLATRPGTE
ncbi:MAG: DUF4345 domain-containing protein [Pseudomonadota bacterium]